MSLEKKAYLKRDRLKIVYKWLVLIEILFGFLKIPHVKVIGESKLEIATTEIHGERFGIKFTCLNQHFVRYGEWLLVG